MGDTCRLRSDDVVPFVDPPQQDAAEGDRPDPVGHLLEADGMLLERVGDEEQAPLEAKGAGIGDALDDEVPGIVDRRQGAGVLARGGPVERGRRPALQELVGALVVVLASESIERPVDTRFVCRCPCDAGDVAVGGPRGDTRGTAHRH